MRRKINKSRLPGLLLGVVETGRLEHRVMRLLEERLPWARPGRVIAAAACVLLLGAASVGAGMFGVRASIAQSSSVSLMQHRIFATMANRPVPQVQTAAAASSLVVVRAGDTKRVEFEAATIKPSRPRQPEKSIGIRSNGRFVATNVTMKNLIEFAYNIHSDDQVAGLSGWETSDVYDVDAKMSEEDEATFGKLPMGQRNELTQEMLQSLLADRLKLMTGRTIKTASIFELVVAKGGANVTPSEMKTEDATGVSIPAHGQYFRGGSGRWEAHGVTMAQLPELLSHEADLGASGTFESGRLVIDKTGLTGCYDWNLQWIQQVFLNKGTPGPSLFAALQEQLGLKLEPAKGPVSVLVVRHLERPSEN